jgi:anaphase-promoting complex subunit 2
LKIIKISYYQKYYYYWIKENLCLSNSHLINQNLLNENITTKLNKITLNISEYLNQEYINIRIENFVEIIKSYPDSSAILPDIKKTIYSIKQDILIKKIKEQIEKRLLTQGIATSLIIEMFIRLIEIMKEIDPSSLILEFISVPIKNYLRKRKDTMRCIINLILNEEDSTIKFEINTNNKKKINFNNYKNIEYIGLGNGVEFNSENFSRRYFFENLSSDEDDEECEKWEPLPLEVTKIKIEEKEKNLNSNSSKKRYENEEKNADIVSYLVNIFGSPEEFVEYYKRMLAERSVTDKLDKFSIENEIKNLELLKVKFGENYFLSCEVLIKDVKDTLKINKDLYEQRKRIFDRRNTEIVFNDTNKKIGGKNTLN